MLLPPSLYSRLAGAPGAAEPLPVERNPAAGAAPFRFTPRPVHFPRDHEFFEVRENLGGRFSEPPTHRAGLWLWAGLGWAGLVRVGGTCGQDLGAGYNSIGSGPGPPTALGACLL